MAAPTTGVTCPVCRDDVPDRPECARCGWTLSTPPWLDVAGERDVRDFEDRLAAARRAFDLAAAVRAAGFPRRGDDTALAGLTR
ncbi:MAG: hypothetical protein HOV94_32990, partial [Saccharothrix sp.]|nr:hypothetical protein [Saccharothrix sp.]